MEKHKIIVAYDFQELSNTALKHAYGLARFINSGILLVLVMNDDLLTLSDVFRNEHSDTFKKKITNAIQREIADRLEKVSADATAESGVAVNYRIETGRIYEKILDIAKENSARFIVMGRTSRTSNKGGIGSNALHIVEESSCPVITFPSIRNNSSFKNIVLPIDLTKQTREEVFNAISFGLFFHATIHLVSVIMGGVAVQRSRIYKKMQGMKKMIEENGVHCTDKLFKKTHRTIHEVIMDYSRDINADALMIMTHQEIHTSDKYIGAVANQIIKESSLPVISLTSAAALYKQSEKSKSWFKKLFLTTK